MRQVKLRSLPLPRCKYKQVYVINQIYFDFSSTKKAGASAPCREGGAMRRPKGTRWSEAESACPLGDRRIAARGRRRKRKSPSASRDSAPFGRAIPPRLRRGLQTVIKKAQSSKLVALFCFRFAEAEGFEPPERCRSTVFKTAAIDHSATPPDINRISCPYLSSLPEGRTYAGRKSNKRHRR